MKTNFAHVLTSIVLTALMASVATASIEFDQDVTPDVIFGSGNANGSWTTDRANGIELGLRAKLRFNDSNLPENTFNSNGDGTYTFESGQPAGGGFSWASGSSSTAVWNFEWAVNSDTDGTAGRNLDDLTYLFEIDSDPTAGEDFLAFDLINATLADHAIGNNSTGNGGGTSAADATEYGNLIANNNVAQNSWNMEFFDHLMTNGFNGNVEGVYTFRLTAFEGGNQVAQTQMFIHSVVPEPTSLAVWGLGAFALATSIRRRRGK